MAMFFQARSQDFKMGGGTSDIIKAMAAKLPTFLRILKNGLNLEHLDLKWGGGLSPMPLATRLMFLHVVVLLHVVVFSHFIDFLRPNSAYDHNHTKGKYESNIECKKYACTIFI